MKLDFEKAISSVSLGGTIGRKGSGDVQSSLVTTKPEQVYKPSKVYGLFL